jgi:type IV secretory pathway VirB10-like protein
MTQPRDNMPEPIDTAPSNDAAPSTETGRAAAMAADDPERLGAEIPALGVGGGRGINKRLIVIMLGVFIIFVLGVIYTLNAIMSARAGKKSKPAEEVVESPPEERKRLSPPPVAAAPAQPIPLNSERAAGQSQQKPASSGPPFPSESFSAQQKGPSIQDKRGAASGPVREGALPATVASEDRPSAGQALISKRIGRPAAGASGGSDSLGALLPGGLGNGDPSSKDPCEISPGQDEESHRQLNYLHGCYGPGGQPKTRAELQLTAKFQGAHAKKLATPQSYLLARGTNIACVMDVRLVSDFEGQVSCTIPNDVFSFDGRNRLISKGSRLLGKYVGGGSLDGNDRVAVTWDRLLTPHGMDIALSEPGTDSMGGSGIPGRYEGHYLQKYSNALMMSLFADVFKYAEVRYAPRIPVTQVLPNGQVLTTEQPFDSATVRNLSRIPEATLGRLLNRPGSVIVEGGQLVNTTLTRDVSFEGLAQAGSAR